MEHIKASIIENILKLRVSVLESESLSDDEKAAAIDQLDDLHERIAYAD